MAAGELATFQVILLVELAVPPQSFPGPGLDFDGFGKKPNPSPVGQTDRRLEI